MASVGVTGSWIYKGVMYEDRLMRMVVDAEGWEEANRFFRDYKGVLKERFEQLDIWIVAYEIEII